MAGKHSSSKCAYDNNESYVYGAPFTVSIVPQYYYQFGRLPVENEYVKIRCIVVGKDNGQVFPVQEFIRQTTV